MLQANSVALITEAMPRPLLGRGIGVQGTAQALGLALGPVVGGALLALGGWRLDLPREPPGRSDRTRARVVSAAAQPLPARVDGGDHLGAVLLALGAAGPLVYLSLASRVGYGDPLLSSALVAASLAAVGFVRRERRVDAPLIDLSLCAAGRLGRPQQRACLLPRAVRDAGRRAVLPGGRARRLRGRRAGALGAADRDRDRCSDRRAAANRVEIAS